MIEKLLAKTYIVMDSFTGNKKFTEISKDTETIMKVITLNGNTLDITVTKRHYVLEKPGWWFFKKKNIYLYEVYCTSSDQFPGVFKQVFLSPMFIPRLLSKFVSEEKQINAVISAFLDIKLDKLKQIKK